MKKMYLALAMLLALITTSSCKYNYGLTHNENHHQTQVVLGEKNYRIVKYVEGDAYARYLFGIGGGNAKRGIIARARQNMLRNAGLLGTSRAIINETVEVSSTHIFFYTEVRYLVSAYIVEFYDPETEAAPQAEENAYAEPEKPRAPNEKVKGISVGYAHSEAYYYGYGEYDTQIGPGFVVGLKTEHSNPDIQFLFWESQLNLVNLNWMTTYNGDFYSRENSIGLELPLLAGFKTPIPASDNIHWYLKAGPFLNASLVFQQTSGTQPGQSNYNSLDPLFTAGAKISTGFQFSKHWQVELGHRLNIGWSDYDYTHLSLNYRF